MLLQDTVCSDTYPTPCSAGYCEEYSMVFNDLHWQVMDIHDHVTNKVRGSHFCKQIEDLRKIGTAYCLFKYLAYRVNTFLKTPCPTSYSLVPGSCFLITPRLVQIDTPSAAGAQESQMFAPVWSLIRGLRHRLFTVFLREHQEQIRIRVREFTDPPGDP